MKYIRHKVMSNPPPSRTADPATGRPWPIVSADDGDGYEAVRWDFWVICGGSPRRIRDHRQVYADIPGPSEDAPHAPPRAWECDRCIDLSSDESATAAAWRSVDGLTWACIAIALGGLALLLVLYFGP